MGDERRGDERRDERRGDERRGDERRGEMDLTWSVAGRLLQFM